MAEYKKEIFVKDYFEIHDFYAKIYGKGRSIILMQVGSFHEAYCTDDKGINLVTLAQELDVICTKKNSNKELSLSNPRMMGFPVHVTHNFIEKLINLNYTIILIDQTTEPPNPKREITGIFSPATYLEKNTTKTSNLVSIVIDKSKTKTDTVLCIGITSYDLSTGTGFIYETYSTPSDIYYALDDTLRFLETTPPREILLINKIKEPIANIKETDIIKYLQLDEKIINLIKLENQEKIKYQEKVLEAIFPNNNQLSVFENLELTYNNLSRLSLVILLDYCLSQQTNILKNIKKPKNFTSDSFMYFGNHALDQLDVFSKKSGEKGLLNIINFTKSSLGQRFLNNALMKPLINELEINKRYSSINEIITGHYSEQIHNYIEDIYDIEKLNRRIDIGNLHPTELYQLYLSFYQINKLIEYLKNNKIDILHNDNLNESLQNIIEFKNYIEKKFNIQELNNTNFNNYYEDKKTFYQQHIYPDIDDLIDKIETGSNFIDLLKKKLEDLISDDKSIFGKTDLITPKFNERDGHYMLITNRRCKILREKLNKQTELNIGSYTLKISDLEFNELPKSSSTKINCNKIKEISNEMIINKQNLAKLNKLTFKDELKQISEKFSKLFMYWSNEIGYIDFINSGAICAIKNKYVKPNIILHNNSYFTSNKLRHPIIESINKNYNYVPHDISLGGNNELDGILLYGINSSGKSTLMKSIGLNIILAQIGYYVAAETFTFSPYNSLFTRIVGNDNLYKGLSSFMVEMMELTSILKRNNKNTLVIGDEICKGTEEKSANIIVSYMLETLSKSNTSFITATHLHKVANLPCVTNLKRVKSKHLKITYDETNEQLIYDRHLSDGQGETFYGLQVAKYLMRDTIFNNRTSEILLEYDENDSPKKSHYNDDFLIECYICKTKKNLESHHIIPQKEFNEDNTHYNKNYIKKDNYSNIITLCSECHDKVDRQELVINGWLETSKGKKLDYFFQEKQKISKYDQDLINYIIKLKKLEDPKMARIKIKETFDKKISTKTIIKYWN